MGIEVHINYEAEIEEWIQKHPNFKFIKEVSFPLNDKYQWNANNSHWGYVNKTIYSQQIMFIGKTGYGKSTTLNKLVGKDVFATSDVSVCTKDLYTAMYRIDKSIPSFLQICDLPGVGETNYADSNYYDWYKEMFEKSSVVVYVLRADQRDFAVDEIIINSMFPSSEERKKLLIAINYADKIEPVNRKKGLSEKQLLNLDKRVLEVSKIFNISINDILYYSAADNINMNLLEQKIADKLKFNFNI
ncbi:GTPase family protein [Clostridium sp. HCP1S3_B4]|uniref:GTPase family protein n=1 Tax=unclassified Clostridium TaxID=2614128 RepID=UPI003F8991EE